jgi:hypothetical protein
MTDRTDFFIGWESRIAPRLARFQAGIAAVLLAGFVGLGVLLGARADDPARADFAVVPGQPGFAMPDLGEVTGTLVLHPYPHLVRDAGGPVLLSGGGKYAAPEAIAALEGRLLRAEGFLTARGTIAMLATDEVPADLGPGPPLPAPVALGTWQVTGEICDGKCASGAMRPGTGIGHRACATLCIAGEVPPVFVPTAPVAGHAFLLLAGPDGGKMPPQLSDAIGLRVRLSGTVERRGGLAIFRAEPSSLAVP